MDTLEDPIGYPLEDPLGDSIGDPQGDPLNDTIEDPIWDSIQDPRGGLIEDPVEYPIKDPQSLATQFQLNPKNLIPIGYKNDFIQTNNKKLQDGFSHWDFGQF